MARSIFARHRDESASDWAQRLIDSAQGMPRESMKRIVRLCLAQALTKEPANDNYVDETLRR